MEAQIDQIVAGVEQEIDNKKIEREPAPPPAEKVVEKPKRARSQKQIEAFEKARQKRAENLAKKRAEEEALEPAEVFEQNKIEKPPPKKRGRPRKSKMKTEEPPAQHFVQPPMGYPQMPYPIQGHPWASIPHPASVYQPPPQPAPVNNYYYYGAPPSQPSPLQRQDSVLQEPTPPPQRVQFQEEEVVEEYEPQPEYEEEIELPPDPRMKYRFG